MASATFVIDVNEKFPHLPAAPIVEAVIQWSARPDRPLEPNELEKNLADRLPDYAHLEAFHQLEFAIQGVIGENQPVPTSSQRGGWYGFRVSRGDKLCIAQFTRDGLVLSRLHPYEDWDHFSAEARRLWKTFVALAAPSEVQRLGVRFVNRMGGAKFDNLEEYLKDPPSRPCSLPLSGFLYQSTFEVPGHPFGIRVVKTMMPPDVFQDAGLILDIDVFTTGKPFPCDDQSLDELLPKMRWLKNKIFFDLLTDKALETFKGGKA